MNVRFRAITASLLGSTAIALMTAAPAQAQPASAAANTGFGTEEIVVTAQKRTSTVQDTPMSVTAVSGDNLQDRGIVDFTDLAQATAGVSLKSEGPSQTEIEMRGMTSSGGNSATVGFYLDDIPLTAPAGAQNGKVIINPTLYDLSRVETLRGPQGTLYGSGSMGGTVRLITNQPDLSGLHLSAQSDLSGTQGGGFNHGEDAMLNIPLSDTLALRIVGSESYTSGWIDRIVANPFPLVSTDGSTRGNVQAAPIQKQYPDSNDAQVYGARIALLWKPLEALSITPSFFYQSAKQGGINAFDSVPGTQTRYQPFDIAEPNSDRIAAYSLNLHYDFGAFDATSVTSYWNRVSDQVEDGSEDFDNPLTGVTFASNNGLPNPGYYGAGGTGMVSGKEHDPSSQLSEELRFSSIGNGRFNWVAGLYYSDFWATWNFDGTTQNPGTYLDLGSFQPATTTSWFHAYSPTTMSQYAVFGDGTYNITDALKLDVGARLFHYDYKFLSVISGWGSAFGAAMPASSGIVTQSQSNIDPKFNLSYTFSPDLMAYATISEGSRPGGGNAQYPTVGPYWSAVFAPYNFTGGKWPTSYRPDSVWSYELGEKARFFDRRLTVNLSVYYMDWDGVQLEALPGDWPLNINGNDARIYGGEAEITANLGHGFQAAVSGGYTHADLDAGPHWQIFPANKLPDVAPFTGDVNLSYETELTEKYEFTARVENAYVGSRYSLSFPVGFTTNGAYTPLPSYDLTNIRAGILSGDGWSATLYANNVFNKHAQLENLLQETLPSAAYNRIITNQPLTIGINLKFSE